ncbi:HpcH/HpaI aldolase family protein [Paracoccus onubensis]|uniref:2,4-dihydroxyhept-2-ene-1,7-dioic acid aldolase n=1 Tax=Paracoccus onubensis TaxID=1675788 RepID=A0A418SN99_9RHOB|nr:aldolase/citrate lyase family protein [Paracoccus onubensis]RJE82367.1 2,4-dihydroxyhept-2-ene-1,7-dioic acid aldolase [Paracoccus onubensis]
MRQNMTRAAALSGTPAFGTMSNLASPLAIETLGHSGYDFLVIDLQHGETGLQSLQTQMQVLSTTPTTPLVRTTANNPSEIQRALDLGAYGLIIPFVNSADEAEAIVTNALYPPFGQRSFGPTRAVMYAGSDYFYKAADELLILPMIETVEGVRNAREILSVPGVSGCFVGPADLNIALGHGPGTPTTETEKSIAEVVAVTKELGKVLAIHTTSVADAKARIDQGFNLMTVAADTRLVRAMSEQNLKELRSC